MFEFLEYILETLGGISELKCSTTPWKAGRNVTENQKRNLLFRTWNWTELKAEKVLR